MDRCPADNSASVHCYEWQRHDPSQFKGKEIYRCRYCNKQRVAVEKAGAAIIKWVTIALVVIAIVIVATQVTGGWSEQPHCSMGVRC